MHDWGKLLKCHLKWANELNIIRAIPGKITWGGGGGAELNFFLGGPPI